MRAVVSAVLLSSLLLPGLAFAQGKSGKSASSEQISLFVKPGLLVSFQELDQDVWNPIRDRLQFESSKLRDCVIRWP